jgi:hypothetical protein
MEITSSLKNKRKFVYIQEQVEGQEGCIFTDNESQVDKKIAFQWNTLFQAFQSKEFQVLLQDDPNIDLSKGIHHNISKFGLYRVVAKPPILPCPDIIEWMTQNIDHESRTLLDFDGKHAESIKLFYSIRCIILRKLRSR